MKEKIDLLSSNIKEEQTTSIEKWLEDFFIPYAAKNRVLIPGRKGGLFRSATPDRWKVIIKGTDIGPRDCSTAVCITILSEKGFSVRFCEDSDWPSYAHEWYEITWDA